MAKDPLILCKQQNEALLSDNLIFPGSYESLKYYSISNSISRISNPIMMNKALCQGVVNLDRKHEQYERTVYSFFDMFGFLGGLFDTLAFSGYLLWNFFNHKTFSNSILTELYQVKREPEDTDFNPISERKQNAAVVPKSNELQLELQRQISEEESEHHSEVLSKQSKSFGSRRSFEVRRSI